MNKYVRTKEEALDVLSEYLSLKPPVIAVDTETTGLNWTTDDLFLAQVGWGWNSNYAFPVEHLRIAAQIIEDPDSDKVLHNAKFDMHFLERAGVKTAGRVHDTTVMARLLLPKSAPLNLGDLSVALIDPDALDPELTLKTWMRKEKTRRSKELTKRLREAGVTRKQYDAWKKAGVPLPPEIQQIEDNCPIQPTYADVPLEIMEPYATGDVRYTLALMKKLYPMLEDNNLLPAYERDMKTVMHVYEWEKTGMAVNLNFLKQGIQYGEEKLDEARKAIVAEAGKDVNLNSPKQILELFHARGVPLQKTDIEALEGVQDRDPLAAKILEFRKYDKLVGTYFKPIYERASQTNGRIHGSFNVAGPVTGRFSSSSPNLQNISNKFPADEMNIKKAFVPSDGYMLVFMDYSQMEVVIMAEYSKDPGLVQAILNKEDIHTKTALSIDPKAKELYVPGLPKDKQPEAFQKIRTYAKRTTFGLFYGIGAKKLAQQIKVDVETARQYINNFFKLYPGVEAFMQAVQRTAQSRPGRYVVNKFGRVYWGEPNREYALVDYLIQGSGADMAKIAIDRCERILEKKKSRLISMVHDELIFEIALDELDLIPQLKEQMTYWPDFELPIDVGIEYSLESWADAKPWPGKEKFLQERGMLHESA